MHPFVLPATLGTAVALVWFLLRIYGSWKILHQQFVAVLLLIYGIYLATLTKTSTEFILPFLGEIGNGAFAGAAIGYGTYLIIGVVGVATGGAGVALGAFAMTLVGAGVGAAGGAAGGFGFKTVSNPMISPLLWVPILLLSIYHFAAANRRKPDALTLE
jgi:hypothetical protein